MVLPTPARGVDSFWTAKTPSRESCWGEMDPREEAELTIQIPATDGSQTERSRGTFGGRQRWLSGANGSVSSDAKAVDSMLSPRKGLNKTCVLDPQIDSIDS